MNYVTGNGKNFSSNVTLSAGLTHVSFNVPIIDDNMVEINEKFNLIINPSLLPFNVTVGNIFQATVNIIDDDGKYFIYSIKLHNYLLVIAIHYPSPRRSQRQRDILHV